jgi:hypothetical protein
MCIDPDRAAMGIHRLAGRHLGQMIGRRHRRVVDGFDRS